MIGVDGFTCFQPPIQGSPEPYEKYIGEAIPWMKATMAPPDAAPSADLLYMPCGTIGRDPHPVANKRCSTKRGLDSRNQPQIFGGSTYGRLGPSSDSGYVNTMKTVFLYAWNEWGELAEQIEPSRRHGYAFADEVREVFDLRSEVRAPPNLLRRNPVLRRAPTYCKTTGLLTSVGPQIYCLRPDLGHYGAANHLKRTVTYFGSLP